jgi:hypothetical protein
MHDPPLVAKLNGRRELPHERSRVLLRVAPVLIDPVQKIPTVAQLRHKRVCKRSLVNLVQACDVGMCERAPRPQLVGEFLLRVVVEALFSYQFDSALFSRCYSHAVPNHR